MKKTLKFLSWMFILLFTVSLSSCKDDDDPVEDALNMADPASAVAGQYEGKLKAGLENVNSYIVVTRETKTEIKVRLVCNTLDVDFVYPCYTEVDERTLTYNIDSDAYYCTGYVKGNHVELQFGEDGDLKFSGDRD